MRMLPRTGRRRNLPPTYPGCWQDLEWRRAYNRMHERIRAGHPDDTRPPVLRCRYRNRAERLAARRRQWRAYKTRVRRGQGAPRPMRTAGSRCFNCWRPARQRIERQIPQGDGKFLPATVPYCGGC